MFGKKTWWKRKMQGKYLDLLDASWTGRWGTQP